mmetsp:Transcript_13090/g.15254  ORF Transcript_13090/g.15254 Transcript_13090/m.15254 type:complete len:92 (+) Transcript_13090:204-479(+)
MSYYIETILETIEQYSESKWLSVQKDSLLKEVLCLLQQWENLWRRLYLHRLRKQRRVNISRACFFEAKLTLKTHNVEIHRIGTFSRRGLIS